MDSHLVTQTKYRFQSGEDRLGESNAWCLLVYCFYLSEMDTIGHIFPLTIDHMRSNEDYEKHLESQCSNATFSELKDLKWIAVNSGPVRVIIWRMNYCG